MRRELKDQISNSNRYKEGIRSGAGVFETTSGIVYIG